MDFIMGPATIFFAFFQNKLFFYKKIDRMQVK